VTRKGGMAAEESKDGRYLYYTKEGADTSLWRVPICGGAEVQIIESIAFWNSFSVQSDGIYYVPRPPDWRSAPVVRFYRFSDGQTQVVGSLDDRMFTLSVSPDQRSVVYGRRSDLDRGADLMLIENFR
jgi:hypothetical protein